MVKAIGYDNRGRLNLSRKDASPKRMNNHSFFIANLKEKLYNKNRI